MTESKDQAQSIFLNALEIRSDGERAEFLQAECGPDDLLRQEVEELLNHAGRLGHFLDGSKGATDIRPVTEQPGDVIGPYKLLQQIGEGGMGVVYMAEQTEPVERRVALKIIKPGMDTQQVIARFEAERQALAMMDHPNIAKVLDAGTTETGRPYFVMELVKGISVTKYCDEQHLSPKERLELFLPICQAVQHAHQKGIIHRDLKPSNILVARYDGKPVPKVIDFGVAKATGRQLTDKTIFTQYGQIVGTIEYMSPEQAEFNQLDVDTRSDVYSLGVLLYELLTGETPFDKQRLRSAAFDELLRIIREEEPPRPSTKLSSSEALPNTAVNRSIEPNKLSVLVRGELDWIVMKALEKDRGQRYETASSFAADIQHYLNDEAVTACPHSAGYRFRKFARRNKAALTTTSLIALTIFLALGSVGWVIRDRAAREEQAAREREERQTRLEAQVELILGEVDRLVADKQWTQALTAARRAEAVVQSGESDKAIRQNVRDVLADLVLVQELDDARLRYSQVTQQELDFAAADRAYAATFHRLGFQLENETVEATSAQLQMRPRILPELAAALTEWSIVRNHLDGQIDSPGWKHLLAVADHIDPDESRRHLRAIWKSSAEEPDTEFLETLSIEMDVSDVPPFTICLMARLLAGHVSPDRPVPLLVRAQRLHPTDFWINFELANSLREASNPEEAVGFYRVAHVLRPDSVAVLNNLGLALDASGRINEAIDFYQQAIDLNPQFAFAHMNLGLALMDQGNPDAAVDHCTRAIELSPDSALTHMNLGTVLARQGNLDEAFDHLFRAIDLDPENAIAHNNLGILLLDLRKQTEAIEHFFRAIDLDPKYAAAHNNLGKALQDQGKLPEAINHYRRAIELSESLRAQLNLAAILIQQGSAEEAARLCHRAIELDQDNVRAHYILGKALHVQGMLDEAIECYHQAIKLDSKDALAHHALGCALSGQGELDKAIEHQRRAIELDSELAQAHYRLGIDLNAQDKLDEAIEHLRLAIALDPHYAIAHFNLGNALYAQDSLGEAITHFRQAIEFGGERLVPLAHNNLAHALRRQGLLADSMREFRKTIDLDPNHYAACNNLAWHLLTAPDPRLQDPVEALELARRATTLSPESWKYWNTRGRAAFETGHWDEGVKSFQEKIELRQNIAAADRFYLAIAHWRLGNKSEARKSYEDGVALLVEQNEPSSLAQSLQAEAEELLGIEPMSEPEESDQQSQPIANEQNRDP